MKFYILNNDYESPFSSGDSSEVDAGTSVRVYIRWLLVCLQRLGEIVIVDEKMREEKIKRLLEKQDAIFLQLFDSTYGNINWRKIRRRILELTLGRLFVPRCLFTLKRVPSAHVALVSTKYQANQLNNYFKGFIPKITVFPPRVDTDFYIPPEKKQRLLSRKKLGIGKDTLHIVYAGRWMVTKGICQLIRALDIWPIPNTVLTLVGNIDYQGQMLFSFARQTTFMTFINKEMMRERHNFLLRFKQSKGREDLRDVFWSADLLVNPSIHPDENFGITPREALSCGLPVVTSNFCGLRELAESMPWQGIDTYPTFFGSRFTLRQLRDTIEEARTKRGFLKPDFYRNIVIRDCNDGKVMDSIKESVEYLLKKPAEEPLNNCQKGIQEIKRRLLNIGDVRFFNNYISAYDIHNGNYIYGDGPTEDAPLFPIIQGIYSALNGPPVIRKGDRCRGFFRISLWAQEKAIVEFGYPGPRIKRYSEKLWRCLKDCVDNLKSEENVFIPKNNIQIRIIQELIDLGYLVKDN